MRFKFLSILEVIGDDGVGRRELLVVLPSQRFKSTRQGTVEWSSVDEIDNSGELCRLASWAHVSTSMGEAFGNLGSFLERVKEQTLKGGPRCTGGGRLSELDVTF